MSISPEPSTTRNVKDPSFELRLSLATKPRAANAQRNVLLSPSSSLKSKKAHESTSNLNSCNSAVSAPDLFLANNGYIEIKAIRNTLQGKLFVAKSIKRNCYVIIKQTDKRLHEERISVQDNMNVVVEENVVNEALILRHLTVDNQSGNDYIVRFIEFLQSKNAYYLVMEHAGNMTLALFIQKAHALIVQNRLKHKHWKKIAKWIFWQLSIVMHWLHNDMRCCHLDFKLENIMILNGDFVENKEKGTFTINPNISIKVVDFGLADIFQESSNNKQNDFKCCKHGMINKVYLSAPRVFAGDLYDARKADIWSLGVILYELCTGMEPYTSATDRDYRRVKKKKIKQVIKFREKTKYINNKMLSLISQLLNTEESERIDSEAVLQNEWLSTYYLKYKNHIRRKSKNQLLKNKALEKKMNTFPYYSH